MRVLFLALVLVNLGYFAWQRQQRPDEDPVQNGPLAAAPHSNTLTLLSEIRAAPAADATPRSNAPQETPAPQAP